MEKLKQTIEQYGRWSPISEYIVRIETYIDSDFSFALGNAKELLETIGKEICDCKGIPLTATSSVNGVIKSAFSALGYTNSGLIHQVSSALATIAQQVGELRNDTTGHGGTLEELQERNEKIDVLTREIVIGAVEIVGCLLIKAFEAENPRSRQALSTTVAYQDAQDFNEFWDGLYGEFPMGDYSFVASDILYNMDEAAYMEAYKEFKESQEPEI